MTRINFVSVFIATVLASMLFLNITNSSANGTSAAITENIEAEPTFAQEMIDSTQRLGHHSRKIALESLIMSKHAINTALDSVIDLL